MKTLVTAILASTAIAAQLFESEPNGYSSIQIDEDGQTKTLYVAMDTTGSYGTTLKVPYNKRAMLLTASELSPSNFYRPNLLGGSVEFDVDLSLANCGCIAAFYLVSAPGKDKNGNYWNTDGYYYCDGNQVGGNYCPEFDIMEAN